MDIVETLRTVTATALFLIIVLLSLIGGSAVLSILA